MMNCRLIIARFQENLKVGKIRGEKFPPFFKRIYIPKPPRRVIPTLHHLSFSRSISLSSQSSSLRLSELPSL